MTYQGCPDCFSKVQAPECQKCDKAIEPRQLFFFRASFTDQTGTIELGISRKPAEDLLEMSSEKFALLKNKSEHIKENVLYREVQITAKTKEEEFRGASITRYYV
jgi:hypothetical protein